MIITTVLMVRMVMISMTGRYDDGHLWYDDDDDYDDDDIDNEITYGTCSRRSGATSTPVVASTRYPVIVNINININVSIIVASRR